MDFFSGDHHFGHTRIIEHCNRPFSDLEEMTDVLIDNHNERVRHKDTVFLVGDMGYRLPPRYLAQYLSRMRGKKKLLAGNHDRKIIKKARNKGLFRTMIRSGELQLLGDLHEYFVTLPSERLRIVLCHYPIHSWNARTHGAWHIHGHSHGKIPKLPRRVDCGVDVWNYYPVSLEEALATDDRLYAASA